MKKILLFAVLLLWAVQGVAAPVDQASAREAAQSFLSEKTGSARLAATQPRLMWVHTQPVKANPALAAYYVVNTDQGFVIVAGDDRCQEILAWGDAPLDDMNVLPANMKFWLSQYEHQMEYLFVNPGIKVSAPVRSGQTVLPLITANWSQLAPYWNECPVYGSDTCYTGCPATSLAMVFHYWKYPRQQTPTVPSYVSPQYGVVIGELPPTTFDWANMLDDYTGSYNEAQATAVAHLMRYIGQAEEMDYTISGSGAYGKDVLRAVKFFEYDQNAQLLFKTDDLGLANYSDAQWGNMIQTELEAGRPIVYLAYDNYTGAGHAFNVDGYDASSAAYHVNWGWNGRGNGYFALNAFSYNEYTFGTGQQMVIGIQPPEGYQNPRLQAYPSSVDMQCYINKTVTATINLKGTHLTDDVTLALDDADGVFSIDAIRLDQAVAEAGAVITVTYSPRSVGENSATITCTSEGSVPLTIRLNGTAQFECYPPEMLPADENRVTLTSFRADWTDNTPAGNVASYTLEVNPKPAYTLLVEADFSDLPEMAPTNQAAHAGDYLPEGWTFNGSEFNLEGGCVSMRQFGTITTDVLNLKGYDKMTIEVTARAYGYFGPGSELYVTTSAGTQELVFMFTYETQTIVVDCAETEQVVFEAGYYPMIRDIRIYAGDATQSASPRAVETGGADYRLVEGITMRKNYTVQNLTAGGTYLYKVKALYIDGTESDWSNVEMVTLVENEHNYALGDVNHDRSVNVTDVTLLIARVTDENSNTICDICGDINGDGFINVTDVTLLINMLINSR